MPAKPPPRPARLPEIGEGKRGAAGHLGYLLNQANAAVRLAAERALADLEVTRPQFAVLVMLEAYPGISGADLARLSLLAPQTIHPIVRNLVRRGAVARRPHAVHGRILRLEVTRAGRALLAACKRRVYTLEARWTAGLGRAEERLVRRWLVAVAASAAGG